MKRLVLIDGNAILHRAYHAFPKLTSKGAPVNAVYGFCSMFLVVINKLKPQYLAVAFDRPEPTFRHQEFVGYQAQRPKMEDDLAGQVDKVKEVLKAMGVVMFEQAGFEADDIIGTIAALAAQNKEPKLETVIVTGDKDLMQLVNKNTKLYLPVRGLSQGELVNEKGVEEKLGIKPGQVVDYKALVGDPSDNYPGVPGVGPKGAVLFLEKFETLEKIYQAIDKTTSAGEKHLVEGISPNLIKKLQDGHESALLSQKLATIITNMPIKLDWEQLKFERIDNEKIAMALKEFGFRSLVGRLSQGRGQGESGLLTNKKGTEDIQMGLF